MKWVNRAYCKTHPWPTNISLDGRKPSKTVPTGDVIRESSIQKLIKTPRTKTLTNNSNARRPRNDPSGL
jgi:hypothetical protein